MKYFNNIKLVSSFRQISTALDVISKSIKLFALALAVLEALLIFKETKKKGVL